MTLTVGSRQRSVPAHAAAAATRIVGLIDRKAFVMQIRAAWQAHWSHEAFATRSRILFAVLTKPASYQTCGAFKLCS